LYCEAPACKKTDMKPTPFVFALSLLLTLSMLASAREKGAQGMFEYADTVADFQRFLQAILEATKNGDHTHVEALLKGTEVPDCAAWLHRMYKADSADSWMGLCDPKTQRAKEKSMAELFAQLAKEGGEFSVRKANDDLSGDSSGFESSTIHAGKEPIELYFASWKLPNQAKSDRGEPIGYFYYLDGGFRWDSQIWFPKIQHTNAKIVHAQLIHRVEPVYPADAAARNATGTVRVYYVIGGDGKVYNAHAISGSGLSEDPALRRAAEDAVLQWRYEPATIDGKPVETNAVTVDLVFPPK
jgi:TonB family protein